MTFSPRRPRLVKVALFSAASILMATATSRAENVTWSTSENISLGILNPALIGVNSSASGGYLFEDVNDDYDLLISTTNLNRAGFDVFDGTQGSFVLEGGTRSNTSQSIAYSTVEFRFNQPNTTTGFAVTGVHFRLEDAENEERFRNFSYLDAQGVAVPIASNSSIFKFSTGSANVHASDSSFDTGATYGGGTQTGKWIDVNLSSTPITGFKFQLGRSLSSYGSVMMSGLGNIIPYVPASPALVTTGGDYRGVSGLSPSGVGTLAALLDGTASATTFVTMDFNVPTGAANQFQAQSGTVRSDVLTLTGTDGDKFVLQLTYDDTGMTLAEENALELMWFNPATLTFVPAVEGNLGVSEVSVGTVAKLGAYDRNTDFLLGNFGVDTENNTVWAVIDHNSDFAVTQTPEPTSALLTLCGTLTLFARRRRTSSRA